MGVLCNSQGGRGRAVGDRNRTVYLKYSKNSILLIRVQGYRGLTEKWKTVKTVHTVQNDVPTFIFT